MTTEAHPIRLAALLTVGLAVVLFFEWHTDEPLVVLPVLLIVAFAAGLFAPRSFAVSGVSLGWSILIAHALSNATGLLIPKYQHRSPATQDWIAMALLVLPALAATFAGARSRVKAERAAV